MYCTVLCTQEYGVTMKASIAKAVAAKTAGSAGAFVSGCIVHCQTVFNEGQDRWDAWEIAGRKPRCAPSAVCTVAAPLYLHTLSPQFYCDG